MRNKNLQWHVFERDSYTCILCNRPASELHHVTHRSQGGRNHPHNLVSVCRLHHGILHGDHIPSMIDTREARQTVTEYLHDYYATEIEAGEFFG